MWDLSKAKLGYRGELRGGHKRAIRGMAFSAQNDLLITVGFEYVAMARRGVYTHTRSRTYTHAHQRTHTHIESQAHAPQMLMRTHTSLCSLVSLCWSIPCATLVLVECWQTKPKARSPYNKQTAVRGVRLPARLSHLCELF